MHCIEIHNAFLLKQRRDCTQSERYKSSERECARVYYVTGVYAVWWQNSLCRMLLHTAAADGVRENYAARANLFSDFPGIYIYTYTRSEWPLFNNDFDSIIESCLSDAHCILCTSYCILIAPGIYIDSLHFELLLVPGASLPSSRSRPLHCAMAPNCCLFCEWAQQIAGQINCVFPMHFAFYIFHT